MTVIKRSSELKFKLKPLPVILLALFASSAYAGGEIDADEVNGKPKSQSSVKPNSAITKGSIALDTVVITGSRAAQRSSVVAKENSRQIIDSVSQDDVGRLPDFSIVQAARRISGVSVVGGGDPTKNRDIFERATIRGLDSRYNLVTVDGVPIASDDQDYRGARLDILPASLVSQIQAIKTVTAEYDPHALGGQLNLVSRSAFTNRKKGKDSTFSANIVGGNNSNAGKFLSDKKTSYRANATATKLFGDEKQFGIVVSTELQHLPSTSFSQLPGDTYGAGWTYYTPSGGKTPFKNKSATGVITPIRVQGYAFDNLRERASINGKLEYHFGDHSHVTGYGGYFYNKDTESRFETLAVPSSNSPVSNQTATSGTFNQATLQQGLVYQPITRKTRLFTLDGLFEVGEKSDVNLTASRSKATFREYRNMIKYQVPSTDGGYSYNVVNGQAQTTFSNPNFASNANNYTQGVYWRNINQNLDNTVDFYKADYQYNFKPEDRGFGYRAGLNFKRTTQIWDVIYHQKNPINKTSAGTLANVLLKSFPSTASSEFPFLLIDRNAANALLTNNPNAFKTANTLGKNLANDYKDTETVKAAYLQGIYQADAFTALFGLRNDHTDVQVDGYKMSSSTSYTANSRKGSYNFLLPSSLITYHLNDDMRLTGGISRTIGRPDFKQYAAAQSYSVSTDGSNTLSINQGNPGLKPRDSWNYDISYEWYLPKGGLFSVAAFYKDIKNEIFTTKMKGAATNYNGTTYNNVFISQPLNASQASVKGLEFQYVSDPFTFLPAPLQDLGVSTNLTLLDGNFLQSMSTASVANGGPANRKTSGLIHQPDYISNLTMFYTKGPIDVRFSYNKTGKALESVDQDTPDRDLYSMARGQLDMQATYKFSKSMQVIIQGKNLTKRPFIVKQGANKELLNNYFPVGRSLFIGLTLKL